MNYLQLKERAKKLQLQLQWIEFAMQNPSTSEQVNAYRKKMLDYTKFRIRILNMAISAEENRINRQIELSETTALLKESGILFTVKNNAIFL